MPEAFEITVHETHVDENVTGKTIGKDLDAAMKAASAMRAYDQVLADEEPTGFDEEQQAVARAGVKAAKELVRALGGDEDHFRVSIHAGADHVNVHVQKTQVAS